MKTTQKLQAKDNLLISLATLLLRDKSLSPALNNHLRKTHTSLLNQLKKDEVSHFLACKNVIDKFAQKLISCENPEMVVKTLAFIEALNQGEVYEVAEGQQIIES